MLKRIVKKVINHQSPLDAYRYNIDKANSNIISGWAKKNNEENHVATIEIRSDDVVLFTCAANIVRDDLKAAGIGSGRYGFSIKTQLIKPNQPVNAIDIFIDGLKANTKPIALSFKSNGSANATSADGNNACDFQKYIDVISTEQIIGWAKKKDSTTHRVKVELKTGDVVLGSSIAEGFRQSIKDKGIGDGCYCFEITPAVHLFPSTKISCALYLDGQKVSTTPIVLETSTQALESAKFSQEFSDELATFSGSVSQELQRLAQEINDKEGNAMDAALENIASLTARIDVIEQILTKHFAAK